jgi:hypothetical protein
MNVREFGNERLHVWTYFAVMFPVLLLVVSVAYVGSTWAKKIWFDSWLPRDWMFKRQDPGRGKI